MKLSDYLAQRISSLGIRHVFAVSGGASLHLIHSLHETEGVEFVCPQHEQAGAMAADGYARVTGKWGAAIGTSGPGATNLVTGIGCSYYDSIPTIFITGQVSTFRMRGQSGARQIGFQETPIVDLCKSITKYAAQICDPSQVRYEFEKAVYHAMTGRPGPVLLDIPDDVQRMEIDPDQLPGFNPPPGSMLPPFDPVPVLDLLMASQRPVIVAGWGIRLSGCEVMFRQWVEEMGVPVALTWAVADLLPEGHPCRIGTFGTHGTRYANFAVQNADLLLSLGSRLDTKATGSPVTTFARGAKKIMVDIDAAELQKFKKFGLDFDLLVQADAAVAVQSLCKSTVGLPRPDWQSWRDRISGWQQTYPICLESYRRDEEVNPYVFVDTLAKLCPSPCHIVIDTGCSIAWMMQGFTPRDGHRLFHDFNNTAMGWALPAAIGACFARPEVPVVCVTGDGSLMMNIQEMATVTRHGLPITMFLINNKGYSMIQQTQDQWLDSNYLASSLEGGLAFPDFNRVANGFGWDTLDLIRNADCDDAVQSALNSVRPVVCNVRVPARQRVIPQVKFGRPNEDPEPLIPRTEFRQNMIVTPVE